MSIAQMRSMREAGFTYKEIGKKLDEPWSTIRSRCQSLGIKPDAEIKVIRSRKRPLKHAYPRWLIYMLYWDCQLSTVDIAFELDMSKNSVLHMMMRMDIPRRNKLDAANILKQSGFYRQPVRLWTQEEAKRASLLAKKKRERRQKNAARSREKRRLQKVSV